MASLDTLFCQERITVVGGGNERLLDTTSADPTHKVEHTTGLVVGAGSTSTAEGLATHHSARRLVVDVEVARRVT